MRTIRMEIELTYDDDVMHCGEVDQEAKAWFYKSLLFPEDRLILHSNDIGDEVGEVKVLSIANAKLSCGIPSGPATVRGDQNNGGDAKGEKHE